MWDVRVHLCGCSLHDNDDNSGLLSTEGNSCAVSDVDRHLSGQRLRHGARERAVDSSAAHRPGERWGWGIPAYLFAMVNEQRVG